MHSKMDELITLIAVISIVACRESTRTCNNDNEQFYRTAIKVSFSNSQILKHM